MANAIKIDTDGTVSMVELNGLGDFQSHVGGWVEALGADDGEHTMWFNEEGKLMGLPLNPTATQLAHELVASLPAQDVQVGPMLITGPVDDEGEDYLDTRPALRARYGLA